MKRYLNGIMISSSILLNAILGGKTNQTFSARNWDRKLRNKLNLVWLIDAIFFFEKDHCQEAWIRWTLIRAAMSSYNNSSKTHYEKNS
jgi:hypothetical protein